MHYRMYFAQKSTALLLLAVLLFSCNSENPITTVQKITVSGKVRNYLNANLSDIPVMIGDKSTKTNSEGKFIISDVIVPYDVLLFDTTKKSGYLYKDISIDNPYFEFVENSYPAPTSHKGYINVQFENGISSTKRAAVFFTNGSDINAHGTNNLPIDTFAVITAFLPDNKPVIGRVIAMIYTTNAQNEILSYDNFGFKDNIELSENGNTTVTFNSTEMNYNPPEAEVSGNLMGVPQNSSSNIYYYYLSFSGRIPIAYNIDQSLCHFNGTLFNVKVPAQLPISYYSVYGAILFDNYQNNYCRGNFVLPITNQTGLQLNLIQNAEKVSPANASTNFNPQNTLQWSHPQSGKIFCLSIGSMSGNDYYNYSVFTSNKNFTFNDISKFNFHSLYDKTFGWYVNTIGGYNSINDFVDPNYKNLEHSTINMTSGGWTFSTSAQK